MINKASYRRRLYSKKLTIDQTHTPFTQIFKKIFVEDVFSKVCMNGEKPPIYTWAF